MLIRLIRLPHLTWAVGGALACVSGASAPADPGSIRVVVTGQTLGVLEPCGCGGQRAGGLANRAAMLAELRSSHPDLLLLEVGNLLDESTTDNGPRRRSLLLRVLASLGTSAVALAHREAVETDLTMALGAVGLPATALGTEPLGVPSRLIIGDHGARLGLISVVRGAAPMASLVSVVADQLAALRWEGVHLVLLVSHLGMAATRQLVSALPTGGVPDIVVVPEPDNEPAPPTRRGRTTWVPLAKRGRSMIVIDGSPQGGQWALRADTRLVDSGRPNPLVQTWVDDYFARERSAAPPADADQGVELCLPCHAKSVAGWRRHPHAHAVATLVAVGRDVPGCLHCHSTAMRTAGRRAEDGVGCGSCHDELAGHLDGSARPTTIGLDGCRGCHTSENSPAWDADEFRRDVRRACLGVTAPRRAVAPRKR